MNAVVRYPARAPRTRPASHPTDVRYLAGSHWPLVAVRAVRNTLGNRTFQNRERRRGPAWRTQSAELVRLAVSAGNRMRTYPGVPALFSRERTWPEWRDCVAALGGFELTCAESKMSL